MVGVSKEKSKFSHKSQSCRTLRADGNVFKHWHKESQNNLILWEYNSDKGDTFLTILCYSRGIYWIALCYLWEFVNGKSPHTPPTPTPKEKRSPIQMENTFKLCCIRWNLWKWNLFHISINNITKENHS